MKTKVKNSFFIIASFLLKICGKFIGPLIKSSKFLKVGFAVSSFVSYSYLFTWKFAALLMLVIFIHESGHLWAMRKCKIKTKGIYFIPFIGGAAVAESSFKTYSNESFVALMGPIWGLLTTLTMMIIYLVTNNPFFAGACGWTAMINLFNLLPIYPLDGGRILRSISFSVNSRAGWVFLIWGFIGGLALAIRYHYWIFFFLLLISVPEIIIEYRKTRQKKKIIPMNFKRVIIVGAAFFILSIGLFLIGNLMSHEPGANLAMKILID